MSTWSTAARCAAARPARKRRRRQRMRYRAAPSAPQLARAPQRDRACAAPGASSAEAPAPTSGTTHGRPSKEPSELRPTTRQRGRQVHHHRLARPPNIACARLTGGCSRPTSNRSWADDTASHPRRRAGSTPLRSRCSDDSPMWHIARCDERFHWQSSSLGQPGPFPAPTSPTRCRLPSSAASPSW